MDPQTHFDERTCKELVEKWCCSLGWEIKPFFPALTGLVLELLPSKLMRKLWNSKFRNLFFTGTFSSNLLLNHPNGWMLRKIYLLCSLVFGRLAQVHSPLALWTPTESDECWGRGQAAIAYARTYAELFDDLYRICISQYKHVPLWAYNCASSEELAMKIDLCCTDCFSGNPDDGKAIIEVFRSIC